MNWVDRHPALGFAMMLLSALIAGFVFAAVLFGPPLRWGDTTTVTCTAPSGYSIQVNGQKLQCHP